MKLKKDGISQTDGSVIYFVISAEWIDKWKAFISHN